MFGWANIRNQNLFVGVFGREIFIFDLGDEFGIAKRKTLNILKNITLQYKFLLFIIPFKFKIIFLTLTSTLYKKN